MNNLLQIWVRTEETFSIEDVADATVTLDNGRKLYIEIGHNLIGECADDLREALLECMEAFTEDLEIVFHESEKVQVKWDTLSQEFQLLFEEHWTYDDSPECWPGEWDYYAEYIGILNVHALNRTNCYHSEEEKNVAV